MTIKQEFSAREWKYALGEYYKLLLTPLFRGWTLYMKEKDCLIRENHIYGLN